MKSKKTTPPTPQPMAGNGMLPPDKPMAQPIVPWLKLDPGTRIKLYCCSSTWLGAQTHWADGRMKIHTTPTCRWCDTAGPIRFYLFLHLASIPEFRQYVVQLASGNMGPCIRAFDQYNTLRGCTVELARRGRSANSPTLISFLTPPFPPEHLPPAFNIRNKLQHAADWNDQGILDFDKPEEATA